MAKIRIEGHLEEDRGVLVCSGESPAQDISWARDEASGQTFVVLEHISAEDVRGQPEHSGRYFGIRLFASRDALPGVGRILEVA